jgi:oxygen-independent coproporphyrinogen-3 oxidase
LKRCGYCDFLSFAVSPAPHSVLHSATSAISGSVSRSDLSIDGFSLAEYTNALIREIENRGKSYREKLAKENIKSCKTVFFGGGTPSLLPPDGIKRIIDAIANVFTLEADAEITLEANPDTISGDYLKQIKAAGVNRLSLGVQSFNQEMLDILDRTHNPQNVFTALDFANNLGFKTSIDLIYGIPNMTKAIWEDTLNAAINLDLKHISLYALTLEKNVPLFQAVRKGKYTLIDDAEVATQYETADAFLSKAGFSWYEISSFSRGPDFQCEHNLGYWRGGSWLGIGAGAASSVGNLRETNARRLADYIAGKPPKKSTLNPEEIEFEKKMLFTRTSGGLPIANASKQIILREALDAKIVDMLLSENLIDSKKAEEGLLVLTLKGRLLHNEIVKLL